jgi:PIN domain nuclease of toxin-antitoxin system
MVPGMDAVVRWIQHVEHGLSVISWWERKLYYLVTWMLGEPETAEDYLKKAVKEYDERLKAIQEEDRD